MKIIDLLNKIAKGEEVPNKIKVFNTNFNFDGRTNTYINEDGEDLFSDMYNWLNALNIKVEIVEEKEIEKIKELPIKLFHNKQKIIANKLNELIDVINDMRDKE